MFTFSPSTPVLRRTSSYTQNPVSEDEKKRAESSLQVAKPDTDSDVDEDCESDAVHPWRHKGPALIMVLLLSCELRLSVAVNVPLTDSFLCYLPKYSGFKFCFGLPLAHEIHPKKSTRYHERSVRRGTLTIYFSIHTQFYKFKVDQ